MAGPGQATALGNAGRYAPTDAAFGNAAWSMTDDFDDIIWMGHTWPLGGVRAAGGRRARGHVAASPDRGGRRRKRAGGRIGASSLLGPLNGQMWTFVHLVGAAVGAARVLGLDRDQTTHALAIALAQPTFARG